LRGARYRCDNSGIAVIGNASIESIERESMISIMIVIVIDGGRFGVWRRKERGYLDNPQGAESWILPPT